MSDSSDVSAVQQPQQYTPLQQNKPQGGDTSKDNVRESIMQSAEVILPNDEETSAGTFIKTISRDGRTLKTSDVQNDGANNPICTPSATHLNQL